MRPETSSWDDKHIGKVYCDSWNREIGSVSLIHEIY